MAESYEFQEPEFVTAGAVGEPGARTFYLQAEEAGARVTLIAEKEQVRSLGQLAQELLAQAGVTVTPDHLEDKTQRLREPFEPAWRAGQMSLGMEEGGERFVLEVEELVIDEPEALEDPGTLEDPGASGDPGALGDPGASEDPGALGGAGALGGPGAAEPGLARFWMTREQLVALAARAAYSVEAGARETCRFCGRPIDADGHMCPSMNGHGPLSV